MSSQSDSNYHEMPNEFRLFICIIFFMKKENVVFVIIFYYTMCIIGLWFASLSAFVAISLQFIRASCEKYLKWLESMESSNYCEGMHTGRPHGQNWQAYYIELRWICKMQMNELH